MRKITTILLAIAMVLSMVVMALPTFAAEGGVVDGDGFDLDFTTGTYKGMSMDDGFLNGNTVSNGAFHLYDNALANPVIGIVQS